MGTSALGNMSYNLPHRDSELLQQSFSGARRVYDGVCPDSNSSSHAEFVMKMSILCNLRRSSMQSRRRTSQPFAPSLCIILYSNKYRELRLVGKVGAGDTVPMRDQAFSRH
jgi:hypothetical protein